MMQYTHRQRGSEAAVPILVSGMKAIGCGEQPLPRVVFWQIVAQKRQCGQKLIIRFLPLLIYFANLKPSGTTPVFT
jgi:hypothetical protein